ncbi:VOC family protein [Actinomadura sp. LOL_016]|uniref:VOC family protein n=1 Tax=unclassified Actinomadura TaxID=2626254 RepID=UPI003A803E3E
MPDASEPAVGRPGWADLVSPNVEAAKTFYCELFGWYVYTLTVPDYTDYYVFTLGDVHGPEVAGMQMLTDESEPASWTCDFCVENIDDTVHAATAEGGQELIPPTDYGGLGRMALCSDPLGADFGLVRAGNYPLFGAVGEPATVCWAELVSSDVEESRRFYERVFGWRAVDREYLGVVDTSWEIGGEPIAGLARTDGASTSEPAAWIPHFQVTDCDASTARAVELGGTVLAPPSDARLGRRTMLADPTGAPLAIVEPATTGVSGSP